VATSELVFSLEKFVTFARSLKGDEKSEGQAFIDHLFRALGHAGAIEAGATFDNNRVEVAGYLFVVRLLESRDQVTKTVRSRFRFEANSAKTSARSGASPSRSAINTSSQSVQAIFGSPRL